MPALQFYDLICELTKPLNDQYPRPWMTKLSDPLSASLFIIGKNQAKGFPVSSVGTHERHLDALFNRNGETCRGLYDELVGGVSSPTRKNTDRFSETLEAKGVTKILETNVICYSTPMSSDLARSAHKGGRERGDTIFKLLLERVRPTVLIAHGKGTRDKLQITLRDLGVSIESGDLPLPPVCPGPVSFVKAVRGDHTFWINIIDSLAPPRFNVWSKWAPTYLESVAEEAARLLDI